jgi:ribosome maturation protein Sdo1
MMAEITDEMVDRAASVIFEPPGLQYFLTPDTARVAAEARNREIIRRALAAALQPSDTEPSDEDRIRDAMTEARDHPGRTITR